MYNIWVEVDNFLLNIAIHLLEAVSSKCWVQNRLKLWDIHAQMLYISYLKEDQKVLFLSVPQNPGLQVLQN